jgi:multidrug transporter EmrE-like cation transporter
VNDRRGASSSSRTRTAWIMLTIAIILLNGGNLILESVYNGRALSLEMFFQPGLFGALAFLGISFAFYSRALAVLPLAVAYPIMVGVTLLIVGVAGYLWLDVDLDALQVIGMAVVFAGVTLISRKANGAAEEERK